MLHILYFKMCNCKIANWNVLLRLTVYRELNYRGQPAVFCPNIAQERVCVCEMHLKINPIDKPILPLYKWIN